ncbi:flavin reductase [Amycolatopsis silviterrae]|uniref:Flavin reductase n=1 Tax=Amycolatopsis silviterrae TaxID=1656914 RepID=A0ABW5H7D4_9PSEU
MADSSDPRHFRRVLGNFPTGVVVVTAIDASGQPAGMAVGSFTSVSLDPALVAFLPDKSSTSFPRIKEAGRFCVNVLTHEQETVCRTFATRGADKFASLDWRPAPTGSPILDGVLAWIDCDLESVTEAGDHYIVLGRVRALEASETDLPLVFFQGGYGRFHSASLTAPIEPGLAGQLRLVDLARPGMERTADRFGVECNAATVAGDEIVLLAGAGIRPHHGQPPTRVGQRIPLVPPLGSIYLAWEQDDVVDSRLTAAGATAAQRETFRTVLARVRQRRWSVGLGNALHSQVESELARVFGAGSTAGPDRRAGLRDLIRTLDGLYEPEDLIPGQSYDVRNVQVPVFDETGSAAISLSVYGLPETSSTEEVRAYREALQEVADEVMRRIGAKTPVATG